MFAIAPTTTGTNFRALDTIVVGSIATLKTLTGMRDKQQVSVASYYESATPDGGGGIFVLDSTSSATANDGTIIAPDAGGVGRWRAVGDAARLNARQFGAKGDGTTNDAAKIQAAIDALPTTGGLVYLPGGTAYRITSSLTLGRRDGLIGDGRTTASGSSGRGATTLLKDGSFDGIVCGDYECIVRDLQVDGAAGNGGDGIYVRWGNAHIQSVAATGQGGAGFRFGDKTAASANANGCYLADLHAIGNTSHGFYFHDANAASNANAMTLTMIDSRGNGGDGLRFDNAYDNFAHGGIKIEQNTGYGLRFTGNARGNFVLYPYLEANTAGEAIFDASSLENTLFGSRHGTTITITDNGTRNTIVARDNGKQGDLIWHKLWMREGRISDPGSTGILRMYQNFSDQYTLAAENGNTTATLRFLNNASGGVLHTLQSGSPHILFDTAIPAGGTAGAGYKFSGVTNFGVFFGSGAPTLSAAKGSIYMRSDGSSTTTRMYVNTDSGTTWTAVTTAS